MKNSNDTIGNRIRDLPVYGAVPQPTAPPHAPNYIRWKVKYECPYHVTSYIPYYFIGVLINVCRLAVDTLNITCKFLYCNHQVHRDFLITLYYKFILYGKQIKFKTVTVKVAISKNNLLTRKMDLS
jgi:hypothetical protein